MRDARLFMSRLADVWDAVKCYETHHAISQVSIRVKWTAHSDQAILRRTLVNEWIDDQWPASINGLVDACRNWYLTFQCHGSGCKDGESGSS